MLAPARWLRAETMPDPINAVEAMIRTNQGVGVDRNRQSAKENWCEPVSGILKDQLWNAMLPGDSLYTVIPIVTYLKTAIKPERLGLLTFGGLLQHDNARIHAAPSTAEKITEFGSERFPRPAFSPDLETYGWLYRRKYSVYTHYRW